MNDTIILKKAMKAASRKVWRENRALNLTTSIARNGKLIKVDAQGKETVVGDTPSPLE